MATDPERWMVPMKTKMETLKAKHTWDLVIPPPGVSIMDLMWIYDIKWDGEGNQIKDKLVKGILSNSGWITTKLGQQSHDLSPFE